MGNQPCNFIIAQSIEIYKFFLDFGPICYTCNLKPMEVRKTQSQWPASDEKKRAEKYEQND